MKPTGTVEIPFNEETKLEIPSKEIKHPDNETNIYDIGVTKKVLYRRWQLDLYGECRLEERHAGQVNYEDAITNLDGLNFGEPTIVVKERTVTETRTSKEDEVK